jgi:hypothetical protein
MVADLEFIDSVQTVLLEEGVYGLTTLIRKKHAEFDMKTILQKNSAIKSIRMPRTVTKNREFHHENYLYEARGEALFVKTAKAYGAGGEIISWL